MIYACMIDITIRRKIVQEKIDTTAGSMTTRCHTTKEERQSHVESWKSSGLTMSEYCRQKNLQLASLSEWKNTLLRKSPKFKPVQLLSAHDAIAKRGNVIDILVDQRIKIRLQNITDVSLVVSIVKGLTTCN